MPLFPVDGRRKGRSAEMNIEQKSKIVSLRKEGYGYTKIAQALGLSKNTVKSYCKRHNLPIPNGDPDTKLDCCLECGKTVTQVPGRKKKKFCSDECRHKWWNARPEKIIRKAVYPYICARCGKEFTAYGNSHRKYCCHACYIADRFKGLPKI